METKLETIKIWLSIIGIEFVLLAICSIESTCNKIQETNQIFDTITPQQQAEFDSIIKNENL